MSDKQPQFTIIRVKDVENRFASRGWPGEMRFLREALQTEQVAISHRIMPQHSGGKGGIGHYHKHQEEVIYVLRGELQLKLDDQIKNIPAGNMIRIAPPVVRALWNDKPEDVELVIISTRVENLADDAVMVKDFWPLDDDASAS